MVKIRSSEITPEHLYLSRRQFIRGVGVAAAGALAAACAAPGNQPAPANQPEPTTQQSTSTATASAPLPGADSLPRASKETDELGDRLTPYDAVTNYNNFYEFTAEKQTVAQLARNFKIAPWTVTVGGLVHRPKTFGMEEILRKFTQQERIYRLRCVEAWSMVIPWLGFPLAELLREVEPMSNAHYVRFETLLDPEQMPGQRRGWYDWPYVEGLRIDEAMHNLTILSTGLYGKLLLPQNGAPLRLVVPWKYGFKSVKSIVKIDLVEQMPTSFWMRAVPNEYGFYANVNPTVPHPRWSQATERRIGELNRRRTLMFNGYAEEVASLYDGMDLIEYF